MNGKTKATQFFKSVWPVASLGAVVLTGMLIGSPCLQAQNNQNNQNNNEEALVQLGFQIAPVPLNLTGKNRDLVGLGSYCSD